MREHHGLSLGMILFVLAGFFFFFAAIPKSWGAEPWPWRERAIAAGLFCWLVSTAIE